jgi:hypothetical protein
VGGQQRDADGWVRLPAPSESPAPGVTASRVAVAVLPVTAALIVLRRRARRRAVVNAWRYRTHGEVSAENQRLVDAHDAAAEAAVDAAYEDDDLP